LICVEDTAAGSTTSGPADDKAYYIWKIFGDTSSSASFMWYVDTYGYGGKATLMEFPDPTIAYPKPHNFTKCELLLVVDRSEA